MKLFDFTNAGYGWPRTSDTYKFMQEQMLELQALSYIGGNTYIIQGCIDNGSGNISNGFVSINGEVLPFIGGAEQPNVVIVPTNNTASFGDPSKGVTPQIYTYSIDRVATFGTVGTLYPWSNFENKGYIKGIFERLRLAEAAITTLTNNLSTLTAAFTNYAPQWNDIVGKPGGIVLYKGSVNIGNVVGGYGQEFTVTIPDQGTNNYTVNYHLEYDGGTPASNANTFCVVNKFRSATQFKFWIREFEEADQTLVFVYEILK